MSAKRSTYLSRVESSYFSRKWYRREVRLFCSLLFTTKWMRQAQIQRCLMTDISEGGASLRIGKSKVPDHIYLVLGSFDYVIGGVVVDRQGGTLHVSFVKELTPSFVNRLSRLRSPFATLESLTSKSIFPETPHPRSPLSVVPEKE